MTRIYVKDTPVSVLSSRFSQLDNYFVSSSETHLLISENDMMKIKNNRIFKLYPNDKPPEHFGNLLIDESFFKETEVMSQIPIACNNIFITQFNYCVGKKSSVHFVIEGYYRQNISYLQNSVFRKNTSNKYTNFQPTSMYFFTKENIKNELLMKEVNVFLSIIQ
tara:strand:- start:5963 stop:6454 length:492 start_codon:yes stop_codon:yes gene_type:complete